MKALVVGHGQLGGAVRAALGGRCLMASGVPWSDPAAANRRLADVGSAFVEDAADDRWFVAWCAGAGVVGSQERDLSAERDGLTALLSGLAAGHGFEPNAGSLFVASSAGGIYASGTGEEHSERSLPQPRSAYGRSKLIQDEAVKAWSTEQGVRTLIGRISNLYGPRQNVRKLQGFISHVCRSMADRRLFTLNVPVSTVRDFVYTDDVAARIAVWADSPDRDDELVCTKLLVAGRSVTLGRVISLTRAVSRTHARVLLASSPTAQEQPAALRFQSRVLTYLDRAVPSRSLEEGIRNTWQATLQTLHHPAD